MAKVKGYRDRIYILKDVILTLSEYGSLNQTSLVSYCGLNLKKHRGILDDLESHGMISKTESVEGRRTITIYSATQKGLEFCRTILDPFEELFPRKGQKGEEKRLSLLLLV